MEAKLRAEDVCCGERVVAANGAVGLNLAFSASSLARVAHASWPLPCPPPPRLGAPVGHLICKALGALSPPAELTFSAKAVNASHEHSIHKCDLSHHGHLCRQISKITAHTREKYLRFTNLIFTAYLLLVIKHIPQHPMYCGNMELVKLVLASSKNCLSRDTNDTWTRESLAAGSPIRMLLGTYRRQGGDQRCRSSWTPRCHPCRDRRCRRGRRRCGR